ncbi:glycine/sarcosine/betaine reductase complex component C subunit beta [Gemelliphila palaticanis]|uniref:Ketoacyl-ACP synthase III family protein n=1 Tax=Gemelliphila palaticanis TaxID=81950 RepID=A0ABX2SYP5_9BACL|nr:glycine/sarcosine/betaine reductase complex component C subunit beta [Gemella palaticanis]MBF0715536.1 ketoacyl-ACP synthase III family protein [Gemella palaticanis]NYS47466.1 ketoacyl-ACP synthase III family protein [Gemella palaticanis]
MSYPVFKGSGYVLVHTPDMIVENGSTASVERITNPDSEFLQKVNNHIRTYEEVVNYLPNQVYIGNMKPEELNKYPMPWYDVKDYNGTREGKFGQIVPQDEFIAIIQMCDAFDLVRLSEEFVTEVKPKVEANFKSLSHLLDKLKGSDISDMPEDAQKLIHNSKIVGYVKKAHDVDVNLNAHVIFENLVVKASGVIAALELFKKSKIDPSTIDYVVECSEEACGDINQRGGGNFAKSIAETCNMLNATGSDLRGFCAAPTHALISAASLVKSGVYKNVLVVAGGASAKLGMNAKDHVKKEIPVLEDVLGGFAILVSENDGVHPIIRTDLVGKHNVGTGSSPQAVMSALITTGLDKANLKITDVDVFSVEMQNPDITKAAGAGNVPEANYKMIGALAAMRGDIEKKELKSFIEEKGLPGWAPTQGHIPSGVPYVGFLTEDLTTGDKNRVMIVGKGSLFLGRMTNQFDGVSFIAERNPGKVEESSSVSKEEIRKIIAESIKKLAENMAE